MGPAPSSAFSKWAGIGSALSTATFQRLGSEITPVRTTIGDAWILSSDETELRSGEAAPASVRLLPSGDTYYLLWGADRELVVPDATHRGALWTSRVWPGALLVRGEIVGTWRRSKERVTIEPWRSMSAAIRRAVDEEAARLRCRYPTWSGRSQSPGVTSDDSIEPPCISRNRPAAKAADLAPHVWRQSPRAGGPSPTPQQLQPSCDDQSGRAPRATPRSRREIHTDPV